MRSSEHYKALKARIFAGGGDERDRQWMGAMDYALEGLSLESLIHAGLPEGDAREFLALISLHRRPWAVCDIREDEGVGDA